MAFDFIFKGFTKAVYSADSGLNLIPSDLGEEMIGMNFDSDAVKRLNTAVGTVASPELFVHVTLTMHILKTSPQYPIYKQLVQDNTIIEGNLTVYDDARQEWEFTKLSIKIMPVSTSGTVAEVAFAIQANWAVNQKLIASLV